MKRYVVTFLFDRQFNVWLIEKQKPEWQKDCLNGIGGKIEPNENSLDAAVRELKEEAGVTIPKEDLYEVGFMWGTNNDGSNFEVYIFTGITDETLSTQEEEKILKMPMNQVQFEKRIDNVPMLLHACHYRLTGKSNFSKLIMEYMR